MSVPARHPPADDATDQAGRSCSHRHRSSYETNASTAYDASAVAKWIAFSVFRIRGRSPPADAAIVASSSIRPDARQDRRDSRRDAARG